MEFSFSENEEPLLTCFKYLPNSGIIVCGLHPDLNGGGLVTLKPDFSSFWFESRCYYNLDELLNT
jgi:hypothetical protein